MSNNVEETLQTKQFIQYQLNKEDLETVLTKLVEHIIERYEVAKREPQLTIKQVSQRLSVDPSTLWRWERYEPAPQTRRHHARIPSPVRR